MRRLPVQSGPAGTSGVTRVLVTGVGVAPTFAANAALPRPSPMRQLPASAVTQPLLSLLLLLLLSADACHASRPHLRGADGSSSTSSTLRESVTYDGGMRAAGASSRAAAPKVTLSDAEQVHELAQEEWRRREEEGKQQQQQRLCDGQAANCFWSFADLVTPFGYPLEEHFVTTADGYILRVFRIPHAPVPPGTIEPNTSRGPPLLLQHGLLDCAAEFLVLGPNKALALLLADAGYDVWLPNARGNVYSRNHTRLDLSSDEFWAFSFDEMAKYDLTAVVEHVLQVTGYQQLSYVGFSQGTTIGFAALSSQPDLVDKIKVAVMLAPVAFLQHIRSVPLLLLATLSSDSLFKLLGINEFLPSHRIVQLLEGQLCYLEPRLCLNILAAINGFNGENLDPKKLPTYLQYTPAGASVQNMAHWAQPHSRTLSHFDWGVDCIPRTGPPGRCNKAKYGTDTPPLYDLASIRTPLMILSGGQDRLADPLDLEYLREVLPAGIVQREVHVEQYEHLDFVWGENADQLLYFHVLDFLALYNDVGHRNNGHSTSST